MFITWQKSDFHLLNTIGQYVNEPIFSLRMLFPVILFKRREKIVFMHKNHPLPYSPNL